MDLWIFLKGWMVPCNRQYKCNVYYNIKTKNPRIKTLFIHSLFVYNQTKNKQQQKKIFFGNIIILLLHFNIVIIYSRRFCIIG